MSKTTLEKLRQLAEKRNQQTRGKDRFWKPADGENVVRFLPAKDGESIFFKEFGEHWVENKRYLCPKLTHGKACPICEAVNDLYNDGNEESTALARLYKGRKQNYANVIIGGLEEEGPKVFKFGIKLQQRIVDDCIDEEVDISDFEEGLDYRVIKKKLDGFPNYDSSRTAKAKDNRELAADQLRDWLVQAEDLHDWIDSQVQTYAEIESEFTGVVNTTTSKVETKQFNEDEFLKEMEEKVA
jgi:phage FluMu protein Com